MVIHRINRKEEAIEALESDLMDFARMVKKYETTLREAIAANNEQALQAA